MGRVLGTSHPDGKLIMRTATFVSLLLVLTLLPAGATAGTVGVLGAPDGEQTGTNRFGGIGPVVPGPEYIAAFDEIDFPDRRARLVADSEGHLLVQGDADTPDGRVERLVAMNAADGSVDWVLDDIEQSCLPVTTDDGRIFATVVANSGGLSNFSNDTVEIDAATGMITNRYTSPDVEDERRLNECLDELRLGADGILVVLSRADDYSLVGIDTTTTPMTRAWAFAHPDTINDSNLDKVVVSADGRTAYLGSRPEDADPPIARVTAVDVATGAEVTSVIVPGSTFGQNGLALAGDALLVLTRAIGGQDDPPRLVALDAETLAQRWVVEGTDDSPFDATGNMTIVGDTVVVNTGSALAAFAVADGAARWNATPSSFSNNGAQIVSDAAGTVYVSTFGGAPLEAYDGRTGAQVFISPDSEAFLGDDVAGEATLGPVLPDGRLYALHRTATESLPALVAYGNGSARLDGVTGDPIDIAIQLCRYLFADDRARTVVLARDDVFADTLAGAPLAGDHSCILFTPGGPDEPIEARTLAEIERALPDGATVRVVGGTAAVSAAAAEEVAAAGFVVERLAGPGRVDTAVAISDVVVAENPGVDTAVIAFAGNWPDAVTAGAAAAAIGAPVLLTGTDALPAQTATALDRYGTIATNVPGGTAVVSDAVLAALPSPTRIAGPNRHATAAAVATTLWEGRAADGAFVLSNLEFELGWSLALAASPLSVRLGAPQLGVRAADLPAETEAFLRDAGVVDPGLIVLGDLTVVTDEVVVQVQATTSGGS